LTIGSAVQRLFNPRYSWIHPGETRPGARLLDVGAGAKDGRLARRYWPGAVVEGVSLGPAEGFDHYVQADLDGTDLTAFPLAQYDYVMSSHLIEHLQDGLRIVDQMAARVRPGGRIYVEWPSRASMRFPWKGVGLNFFDDPTHRQTYDLHEVVGRLEAVGFQIEKAGYRRHLGRMILSPVLALRTVIRERRLLLYDLWDVTGFCYVVRGVRQATDDGASHANA
jgi:SAM-dependent methyltransferase